MGSNLLQSYIHGYYKKLAPCKVFQYIASFLQDLKVVKTVLPWYMCTVRGKIWRGKILANLANGVQFAKIFYTNSYKYSEITEDLPADSPKFSSPFASSVMIRQNSLPPKFSHVWYHQIHAYIYMLPYIANCSRWKSFAVVEINCNSLENIHGCMVISVVWPNPIAQAISLEKFCGC